MGGLADIFGDISGRLLENGGPIFVSPPPASWNELTDPGAGTLSDPYHSISTGIAMAAKGRRVYLRGGQYTEQVKAFGIRAKPNRKIVIQPYGRERVTIDCLIPEILHPTQDAQWQPVQGSLIGEFIWTRPFGNGQDEEVAGGAFLETRQHTRVVTYDHLEDLRSANEFDPRSDPTGDNHVWVEDRLTHQMVETQNPELFRNWVYMGPGICFDKTTRRLHVRLSHTHNNINGWPDYTGDTDPRGVKLALSKALSHALFLESCSHIRFKNLTVRFGGADTIRLRDCTHIEFDHVNIRAGSGAIRLEAEPNQRNKTIVFQHCEIDGGMPTWFFRSDRKEGYFYVPASIPNATSSQVRENRLGESTTGVLISSRQNASDIRIHHCKIFNGHDVCVFGENMRFHHNWVDNINDDALFMGSEDSGTNEVWIYGNVITQVLTALSFAADTPVKQVRIFRNLIDIRQPTLGIRPGHSCDNPFRQGQFYKSNGLEGAFDLWHNTCLVLNAGATLVGGVPIDLNRAGFTHYREFQIGTRIAGRRRAYNNIFVAAYPYSDITMPIAFLPPASFHGPTDGNTYERVGPENPASVLVPRFEVDGEPPYNDIADYIAVHKPWEECGKRENPLFVFFDHEQGHPYADDDLRLQGGTPGSPAKNTAVVMPDDITTIDRIVGGLVARWFGRDRGCYLAKGIRMSVGVNGNEKFPR